MSQPAILDGVFAVHKPTGISSADVLRDLQRHFNPSEFWKPWIERERSIREREARLKNSRRKIKRVEVKLGHGGTLDPMATGVLIVGAGRGTKELNKFLLCKKVYETVVVFGCATDTYDRVGKVVSKAPYEHITREMVEETLAKFRGHIMQRPSIYSALKQKGKKLYEYAREGIEPPFEIAKRPVEVSNLEIVEWYPPGTHHYEWPSQEAGLAEKRAVSMVNKAGTPADESHKDPDAEGSGKRKQSELDDKTEDPTAKRSKETEGAARPAPSTESSDLSTENKDTTEEPKAQLPAVKLTLTVSSGFYVRSFAHDLGLALGSNALMSELVRARQGDFGLDPDTILEYKDLEAGEEVWGPKLRTFLDGYAAKTMQSNSSASNSGQEQPDPRSFLPAKSPVKSPRRSPSPQNTKADGQKMIEAKEASV
ncbi:hypothetical protein KEM56_001963 [Ascosphaera pollenicola]|nr:hypothetical protein KEM56_001963 [Ascosphaera pollenicola]